MFFGCGVRLSKSYWCTLGSGATTTCTLPCGLGTLVVPNVSGKTKATIGYHVKVHHYTSKAVGRKLSTVNKQDACFVMASNDYYCAYTEKPLVVDVTNGVMANDTIACDGGSVTLLTQMTHGTVVMNSDGSFTYTPIGCNCYNGVETFTYTLADAYGNTAVGTVTLYVGNGCPPNVGNPMFFGCGVRLSKNYWCTLGSGATTTCNTGCSTLGSYVVPNIVGKTQAELVVNAKVIRYT